MAAVGLLAVTLAGCGGSGSSAAASTTAPATAQAPSTTAPATSDPDPDATDKAAITKLYNDWADLVLAKTTPDATWDDVDLTDYLAGPLLLHITKVHADRRAAGEVLRLPTPTVSSGKILRLRVQGTMAKLETCQVDDAIVETKGGAILNDRVTTFHDSWTAVKGATGWRFEDSERLGSQSGIHSCSE